MARLNPTLDALQLYLKTSAGRALPSWLRTAIEQWPWPKGYAPDPQDFAELAARLRQVTTRTQRKSVVSAKRTRPAYKHAG